MFTIGQSDQFMERYGLENDCRVLIIDGPVGMDTISSLDSIEHPYLIISKNDIFGVCFNARVGYMIGDEGYLLDIPVNKISLLNAKDRVSNADFEFSGICDNTKSLQYNVDHHLTELRVELPSGPRVKGYQIP